MNIVFRILSGGGGMVQGITNGEFKRLLEQWTKAHGQTYTLTSEGYLRKLTFDSDADAIRFMLTFKPQADHWWRNARIEQ